MKVLKTIQAQLDDERAAHAATRDEFAAYRTAATEEIARLKAITGPLAEQLETVRQEHQVLVLKYAALATEARGVISDAVDALAREVDETLMDEADGIVDDGLIGLTEAEKEAVYARDAGGNKAGE